MSEVRLVAGTGLVGRTDTTVWWTSDERLLDALLALSGSGFKGLADAILELDFEIGGVAAVDLKSGAGFVSGAALLVSGSVVADGSTTGTWIEQPLADPDNLAVNAFASTVDAVTDLRAGVVRGGGFVFGQPALSDAPSALAAIAAEPKPRDDLEDPAAEVGEDSEPFDAAETMVIPSQESEVAGEEHSDSEASEEPRKPIMAIVEFDDGRHLELEVGLIVGRNPASGEIPIGFDSLTVLGEFVSRRHWQLDMRSMAAVLTDLGSASGTIVEVDGEKTRLGPADGIELGARSKVLFADHWATVKVKQA